MLVAVVYLVVSPLLVLAMDRDILPFYASSGQAGTSILVFLGLLRIAHATGEHLKLEVFILGRTGRPGLQLLMDSGC